MNKISKSLMGLRSKLVAKENIRICTNENDTFFLVYKENLIDREMNFLKRSNKNLSLELKI